MDFDKPLLFFESKNKVSLNTFSNEVALNPAGNKTGHGCRLEERADCLVSRGEGDWDDLYWFLKEGGGHNGGFHLNLQILPWKRG